MTDKDLNLFNEFAAELVHLCPQEEKCTSSSSGDNKIYTPGTIANLQTARMSTVLNKNGALPK